MNVLFAVWEIDPFIKVGGLGDVARSLPGALSQKGIDIRIVVPFYRAIKLGNRKKVHIGQFKVKYDKVAETVDIIQVTHPYSGVPVYLLKNNTYLSDVNFPDTFTFFDKAIINCFFDKKTPFTPDIIHCNDLHTGLIPFLVREYDLKAKTMLTIHNLSYQGKMPIEILNKMEIQQSKCKVLEWEIKSKQVNLLTEGIIHADVVTTVSPTYSREIMTEEFGCGLEEILRGKEGRVFGILNGIDDDWRNLMHAKFVKYPFLTPKKQDVVDIHTKIYQWEEGKGFNKQHLQKKLELTVNKDIPMIAFVGRFDSHQKGIDILHKMMRRLDLQKYQFVILGTGDPGWEERFQWLDKFFPDSVSVTNKFDECLAHEIYAAADFILIPSKFEPCGLIQMIAMFFGTLPIAHRTGGLSDSIQDGINGFLFEKYSSVEMERVLMKAIRTLQKHKREYRKMVEMAMQTDFSWNKSAKEYIRLYNLLLSR